MYKLAKATDYQRDLYKRIDRVSKGLPSREFKPSDIKSTDGKLTHNGKSVGTYKEKPNNLINKAKDAYKAVSYAVHRRKEPMAFHRAPSTAKEEIKFRLEHGGTSSDKYYKKWGKFYGVNPDTREQTIDRKQGG